MSKPVPGRPSFRSATTGARKDSGAGQYLVAFDVDGIQDYVFAPVRPLHVAGGSRIIERFTRRWASTETDGVEDVVYAGGGGGVLLARDAEQARELGRRIAADLRERSDVAGFGERTRPGAVCTVVSTPLGDSLGESLQRAQYALIRKKQERALRNTPRQLVPAGAPPCQACGREPGVERSAVEGPALSEQDPPKEARIGAQCMARERAARPDESDPAEQGRPQQAASINDLFADGERDGRRALAAVYLDADSAGARLRELGQDGDLKALQQFAEALSKGVEQAVDATVRQQRLEGRFLAPVLGGDDVVLFVDARQVTELLQVLVAKLGPVEKTTQVTFSGAVTFGPEHAPLRLLLEQLKADLRRSKTLRREGKEPMLTMTSLLTGRLHRPGVPLFGGPVPRSLWVTGTPDRPRKPALPELLDTLGQVGPAQRAGIAEDLSDASVELQNLNLAYRAVPRGKNDKQSELVRSALAAADELLHQIPAYEGRQPNRGDILGGGLAAAELIGGQTGAQA